MKVIIIGAGSGKRIGKFAEELPKSLLDINGKSILENQISLFKKKSIDEIIVITGPNNEKFNVDNITYVHDKNFENHDILGSLMVARDKIFGDVLIVYSDIMFEENILKTILESNEDISIAVDLEWEKSYENRTEHPKFEAENVVLDKNGKVIEIRKNIQDKSKQIGEFLGIVKMTTKGSEIFVNRFLEIEKVSKGKFHTAKSFEKAYLTDMIQELIDSKVNIFPITISGKWCEIDTMQDLENARKKFRDKI